MLKKIFTMGVSPDYMHPQDYLLCGIAWCFLIVITAGLGSLLL
jgi:hypothetical protein